MNTKHTPGPWAAYLSRHSPQSKPHRFRIEAGQDCVAVSAKYGEDSGAIHDRDIMAANAALIASAPELLAALEAIISGWDSPTYGDDAAKIDHCFDAIEQARAAIAKATQEE